jgi:hypothetical protein
VYDANHDHYTCPAGEHLTKARARSNPGWAVPTF